jgi:uncharacterized membrane protein YdbT with pleckstrin-like domain
MSANINNPEAFDPATTTRPIRALLTYYTVASLFALIAFPIVFVPQYCKYITLRYKFDSKGITMSWGVLFKKEIYLTYRRIQDIHVSRGIIQRWLGLATVSVQTASGSVGAQMAIVGIGDPQGLRDYLYSQMRGVKEKKAADSDTQASGGAVTRDDDETSDEALALLTQILEQVRALRSAREGMGVDDGRE